MNNFHPVQTRLLKSYFFHRYQIIYTMSLIPLMFGNWWDDDCYCDHPLRLLDQQFHPGLRYSRQQTPAALSFVIKPRRNEDAKQQGDNTASIPEKDKFQVVKDN